MDIKFALQQRQAGISPEIPRARASSAARVWCVCCTRVPQPQHEGRNACRGGAHAL